MLSAMVTAHQKSFQFVLSSLEANTERITSALVALASSPEEGRRVADATGLLVRVIRRHAEKTLGLVVDRDEHLAKERADDAGLAARRDEMKVSVRDQLIRVRQILEAVFGPNVFKTLGVSGSTPEEAVALGRFAHAVVNGLSSSKLPAPLVSGASFDPRPYVAQLAPAVTQLERALADINADARENQAALMDRDRAFAESRQSFSLVANFTSALLALAGLTELSKRVRPTGRTSGTVADTPESESDLPSTGSDPA